MTVLYEAQQLSVDKDDPDKKALACYGLWLRERGQMMLRFVEERPVSDVTCAFLDWVCQTLAPEGKRVLVLVWDNATNAYLTAGLPVDSIT